MVTAPFEPPPSVSLHPSIGASGWSRWLEDPLRQVHREPLARWFAQRLFRIRIMPDRVVVVSALFAAASGVLVTTPALGRVVGAGVAFELSTILGRAGTLLADAHRAHGTVSESQPANLQVKTAAIEWLGVLFLYGGLFYHVLVNPPPAGVWSTYASPAGVLLLALLLAIGRTAAASHYRLKYSALRGEGRDAQQAEGLRRLALALGPSSPRLDVVVLCLLLGRVWMGQLLFVMVSLAWLLGVAILHGWLSKGDGRRAKLEDAQAVE
ncbi:hypothetical protein [Chondromyces crocatus]|uniref:Uncharacterized protein n=1 Tax=Chondromyces crocatus TaxID=52 RepID=A0A0K1ER86_CHOCO|nr:hypothetical protein [Chondromyces crocatus]AKT43445.1 uncharacterized protein CMC5_076770 [Chondromyces crocatus]